MQDGHPDMAQDEPNPHVQQQMAVRQGILPVLPKEGILPALWVCGCEDSLAPAYEHKGQEDIWASNHQAPAHHREHHKEQQQGGGCCP